MRISDWSSDVCSSDLKQGLYDPIHEHDACGVGFIANIKGRKSNEIIGRGLEILLNIDHRGAVGADPLVGDGAGILIQIPDELLRDWAEGAGVVLPQPGDYAVAMCFMPRDENEIGRASCRERVCQYVSISVVAVSLKKKSDTIT